MLKKVVYLTVILFVIYIFARTILSSWPTVTSIRWNFNLGNLIMVFVFSLGIYLVNVFSWHIVTQALALPLSLKSDLRIWMLSNLSRLVPGGIWQYPSRIYLLSRNNIPKSLGTVAILIEGLFNLSMGASMVLISLPFWKLPPLFENYRGLLLLFLLSPLLLLLFLNKGIISKLTNLLQRLTHQEEGELPPIQLTIDRFLLIITSFLGRFIVTGGALFFLINLVHPMGWRYFVVILGLFSLSWLAGYIAIFAPGGLGVLELSLATLLSIYMPFSIAVIIAITFRIVLFTAEALFLGLAFFILKIGDIENRRY